MVIPHAINSANSSNNTYSKDNGRYPYKICSFNGVQKLSDIPCIFEVMKFLEEEYGMRGYYRLSKTFEKTYRGMTSTRSELEIKVYTENLPQTLLDDLRGIVLYDSFEPPPRETDEDGNTSFYYLPNLYINAGTLILEVPSKNILNKSYDKKYWTDLVKILKREFKKKCDK